MKFFLGKNQEIKILKKKWRDNMSDKKEIIKEITGIGRESPLF